MDNGSAAKVLKERGGSREEFHQSSRLLDCRPVDPGLTLIGRLGSQRGQQQEVDL